MSSMKHQNWIASGAIIALLAAASPALKAQDNGTSGTTPPPAATDTTPSAGSNMSGSSSGMSGGMSGGTIDYSLLNTQAFDYLDLKKAQVHGYSDNQIATIAKIAEQTGERFSDVRAALGRGESFVMLAQEYNLSLADLYDVDAEKAKIENYKRAYETTGTMAMKATNSGMMSSDMTSGGMSGGMPPTGASSGSMSSSTATAAPAATGDVVDVAMATPQLSTLVKALQAAGLTDTLKGAGPFTVFAPSNRAFARLPQAQRDALMADPAALKNVLTYHVISGQKVDAAAAMAMTSPTSPPTVQGGTLNVTTRNGRVMVNDATVVRPDIQASNGIIHIINRVLMPPAASGGAPAPTPSP